MDDVLVHSRTFEEHIRNLEAVFARLRSAGLKLRTEKCQFFRSEVPYLGHIISAAGIATDPSKVEKVRHWPQPRNKTEIRSFINFAGCYRRFVQDFSTIAAPLHDLTTQKALFKWSPEAETGDVKTKTDFPACSCFPSFFSTFSPQDRRQRHWTECCFVAAHRWAGASHRVC